MSSLYRKRGIFYYQGKDEDGNRFQKSLRTRDRAEAKEKKEKLDERFSTDTPSTLAKLVEDYLEHRRRKVERDELSDQTVGTDEYVLPRFLEWTKREYGELFADELDSVDLSGYKTERLLELTRFSGQCAAFTPRQVNEVPQNENGLVNGTPLRSDSATGTRSRNAGARDCTSPQ